MSHLYYGVESTGPGTRDQLIIVLPPNMLALPLLVVTTQDVRHSLTLQDRCPPVPASQASTPKVLV